MNFSTALIFLLTVLDILVYYLQKQHEEDNDEHKKSSLSSSSDQQRSLHEEEHDQRKDLSSSWLLDKRCRCFSLAEIKLATNDFDDAFVIGKGGFGKVYKGKIDFGEEGIDVAIKRPALDFTLDEQQHSLAVWAKNCIKEGKIDQIIDPCLKGQTTGNCVKEFGRIAYECVLTRSKDRPTMSQVVARLEFVLAWTLQSGSSARDRKQIGRAMFIEKAWSLFLIKSPKSRMSSPTKKLGQSINKKKGVENASQKVLLPTANTKIPILKMFKFSELQSATRNFKQEMFLGEGGYGKVFKGWLDSVTFAPRKAGGGLAVAIKRSSPNRTQGLNEWQAEVKFLGTFSHPNIVKLFGYCWENKEFLLVYEFMQKGSLDMQLFREGVEPLPWDTRIKIATGAAQGLAFLHTTENNVICRDVKSSNILLDGEFNAKLSDFGLAKSGPVKGESHVSTDIAGTYGYMAPEYIATGRLYVKSDVYGFGVVMLEIITGLRASDYNQDGMKQNLVEWATPFLTDIKKLEKIMDPRLGQNYPSEGASKAAELILSCLDLDPKNRPSMEEVVLGLQVIGSVKMEPGRSTGSTRGSMSPCSEQSCLWSPLRGKQGRAVWSMSTRLLGLNVCLGLGSKEDPTWTETNCSKTGKWGN
ncbi:unnamed protein product [Lactuca virosa]|uniref:non-specific serine/threonine protein kinase n=1 Tax=Lactuca virosa TaxID=75947 RepID=A0AAU9MZT5_9ASTR|nr:unnamed protein product [Lactuca virosa]